MTTLRNTLAIALTALTLSVGAIETSSDASAHGYFHGGGRFHHEFGRMGHRFGWDHHRFGGWDRGWGRHRYGWGRGCIFHWGCRGGGEHRWGYWGGYRRVAEVGVGVAVAEAPVVVTPRCPEGTHLGYRGKYCWPNRR